MFERESDPNTMIAVMLGLPGATVIEFEFRVSNDSADLLIETEDRSVR